MADCGFDVAVFCVGLGGFLLFGFGGGEEGGWLVVWEAWVGGVSLGNLVVVWCIVWWYVEFGKGNSRLWGMCGKPPAILSAVDIGDEEVCVCVCVCLFGIWNLNLE